MLMAKSSFKDIFKIFAFCFLSHLLQNCCMKERTNREFVKMVLLFNHNKLSKRQTLLISGEIASGELTHLYLYC